MCACIMYVRVYVHMYLFMYVHMYVCMCVRMYMCVCMYVMYGHDEGHRLLSRLYESAYKGVDINICTYEAGWFPLIVWVSNLPVANGYHRSSEVVHGPHVTK